MSESPCILAQFMAPAEQSTLATLLDWCQQSQCHIQRLRLQNVNNTHLCQLEILGHWHGLAKLEAQLESQTDINQLQFQRTQATPLPQAHSYRVNIYAPASDSKIDGFLRLVNHYEAAIHEIRTHTYQAPNTPLKQCKTVMRLCLPMDTSLSDFRETCFNFGDSHNIELYVEVDSFND